MNESGEKQIPLSGSDITEKEKQAVLNVLGSPYLSLGPRLPEFEEKMSSYIGTKHAVAVNSGTSALHLIVRALGITAGDEVITTPFSFIASANCILFENARPVFADIDKLTLNIDPDLIEGAVTEKTKAILAVDVFGHPAEWDKLKRIAKKHGLKLIEDSCEAIGAEYKGRKAGTFGAAGTFAFYPNKQITTGEGGMIVTDDGEIAEFCESSRNQGRNMGSAWLSHERLGYNYRLSDINCALGTCQLGRISEILGKRDHVAEVYGNLLKDVEEIELPYISEDVKISWFVYVVRLKEKFTEIQRNDIIKRLKHSGIGCSNYFAPIHLQPFYVKMFGYKKGDYPVTESVSERTIALPFYSNLKDADIARVVRILKEIIADVS